MRSDRSTSLICIDLEDQDGALVDSRVVDADDARRIAEALEGAWKGAQASDAPVVVDLSAVIGRD